MNFTQQLLSDLFQKAANFQPVKIGKVSQGSTIAVNLGYGSVRAQALQDLAEGGAVVFQTDQGNWYLIGSKVANQSSSSIRPIISRRTRPTIAQYEPYPVNVQIFYFVWTDGYFNWLVGGDREILVIIDREADDDTFPPTSENSPRGVNYSQPELSNISNKNKQNFRAIFAKEYYSNSSPDLPNNTAITSSSRFQFNNSVDTQGWESIKRRERYYEQGYGNFNKSTGLDIKDVDLTLEYRLSQTKSFSFVGNGYAFSRLFTNTRHFFVDETIYVYYPSNIPLPISPDNVTYPTNYPNTIYPTDWEAGVVDPIPCIRRDGLNDQYDIDYVYGYEDLPDKFIGYLSYLEPTKEGSSNERVVPVTINNEGYAYSLPCALATGTMPLKNKITTFSFDFDTYSYEGEHYLITGGDSYITEYIKKESPTQIKREIRFYKDRKFVRKLNVEPSLIINNYTFFLDPSLNLIGKEKGDIVFLYSDQLTSGFYQQYIGKTFTVHGGSETDPEYENIRRGNMLTARCILQDINSDIATLLLLTTPKIVPYSSLTMDAYGHRQSYKQGVLSLEQGSFYDFVLRVEDANLDYADNDFLGAYNATTELVPFNITDKNYLYYATIENKFKYDFYYQIDLYGSGSFAGVPRTGYSQYRNNAVLRYRGNNFCSLYGNKLYRYQVVQNIDGYDEALAYTLERDALFSESLRSKTGKDNNAICYIEEWVINESNGKVKKSPKLIELPVYGLPDGLGSSNDDIRLLDVSIGFNR